MHFYSWLGGALSEDCEQRRQKLTVVKRENSVPLDLRVYNITVHRFVMLLASYV